MPPSDDVEPPSESIQSLPPAASSLRLPKMRQTSLGSHRGNPSELPIRPLPMSHSEASLPARRSTPTAASLYASTLTPPGSRSISPVGRAGSPARTMSMTSATSAGTVTTATTITSNVPPGAAFARSLLDSPAADNPGDPLNLILKAFVPHVAVYSSRDTDELARDKGFPNGLWELLRPFGEQVQGKVQVRDSNGAARPWDDFSVRFVKFGDNIETPETAQGIFKSPTSPPPPLTNGRLRRGSAAATAPPLSSIAKPDENTVDSAGFTPSNATAARIPLVEAIVDKHLCFAESSYLGFPQSQLQPNTPTAKQHDLDVENTSPYYSLYLRRMLSGIPVACHETFAHPVACVIAISSRNPSPIQTFQELYRDISQGDRRLPGWVNGDFLRYYVLVHDEENGDIVQSMALFEKMKRSLGLHCHLLRIRSTQSAETDDDSIQLPRSDWMTAVEEYTDLERGERLEDDFEDPARYIFESDATAIRTFVREMVTQSIVPTMERSVALWNDQVASKRKGLSGRFTSLSKRFAGFGGGGGGGGSGNSGSNYDAARGYYGAEAPEAILRRLADYAFMLRDWKLAMSTYDILRSDFTNDKAWRYHAAANEMCALSLLIMPPALSSRTKLETIGGMLEQAFYSYHTRCGSRYGAVRSVALALELQRLRGGAAMVDDAARWGMRLLEARLVGPVGDALLCERMAVVCATRPGWGALGWGSWRRKSAFWSVLAAEAWLSPRQGPQGKYIQAQRCLNEARKMYSMLQSDEGISGFALASGFMLDLQQRLKQGLTVAAADAAAGLAAGANEDANDLAASAVASSLGGAGGTTDDGRHDARGGDVDEEEVELLVDETTEKLARRRSRRDSLLGAGGTGQAGLESAPLRRLSAAAENDGDDGTDARPDSGFGQV